MFNGQQKNDCFSPPCHLPPIISRIFIISLLLIYNYFAIFSPDTGNKKSKEVVNNLAKVDDFCTKLDIGLVKINDLELVTEYNLGELPALVYYRHGIPILYEGELSLRLKMEG